MGRPSSQKYTVGIPLTIPNESLMSNAFPNRTLLRILGMCWVHLTCVMYYECPDPSEITDGFRNGFPSLIGILDVKYAGENLE